MDRRLFPRKLDFKTGAVEMAHGSGGKASAHLVEEVFAAAFDNPWLAKRDDQAVVETPSASRLAVTTDSFVVSPLVFPGGDIGSLAVHGTVNDLAMAGAWPLYLTAGFILEEGFPLAELRRIALSMAAAARAAGVAVVAGDTKVVERGKGDGVFINTTGIGTVPDGVAPSADRARPGDAILVNGPIGDHGVAIMACRENLAFETAISSDSTALHALVSAMLAEVQTIHVMRDPTRGGLATALNEIAHRSGVGMEIEGAVLRLRPEVEAACELLGLDPLYVANEGKLIAICAAEDAERLLGAMRAHPLGRQAAVIGRVTEDDHRFVQMVTRFGGRRIVDWLAGEQLPRIC